MNVQLKYNLSKLLVQSFLYCKYTFKFGTHRVHGLVAKFNHHGEKVYHLHLFLSLFHISLHLNVDRTEKLSQNIVLTSFLVNTVA